MPPFQRRHHCHKYYINIGAIQRKEYEREGAPMDNFRAVYKILSALERAMDYPKFDLLEQVSPEHLKVSEERYNRYLEMMADVGYIKGVQITKNITGETQIDADEVRITLKGLEYLQENSIMRKMYQTAKGIKEIIP